MIPIHSKTRKYLILFLSLIGLILITARSSSYCQFLNGNIVPFDIREAAGTHAVLTPKLAGDLEADGDMECLERSGQSLQITNCVSDILWQAPTEWRVTEAQVGDLNHDGVEEAVLLVWRAFRPWPAERFMPYGGRIASHQNHAGQSCQVILIGWQKGTYREIWAGSALANPISDIQIADLDGDGLVELSALENDYDSKQKGGKLTIWRWGGFVFSLLDRSESRWERLAIMGDGVHHWIATR